MHARKNKEFFREGNLKLREDWDLEESAESEEEPEYFCPELRKFKVISRNFHDWIAKTEAIHNPRSLDRESGRQALEMLVAHPFVDYTKVQTTELTSREKEKIDAVTDEILDISKKLNKNSGEVIIEIVYLTVYGYVSKSTNIVPLFKVYGNKRDDFMFITMDRKHHDSLLSFMDNNSLPHSLVCAASGSSKCTYEFDSQLGKYPLAFYTVNFKRKSFNRGENFLRGVLSFFPGLSKEKILIWGLVELGMYYFGSSFKGASWNMAVEKPTKFRFFELLRKFFSCQYIFGSIENFVMFLADYFVRSNRISWIKTNTISPSFLLNGNLRAGPTSTLATVSDNQNGYLKTWVAELTKRFRKNFLDNPEVLELCKKICDCVLTFIRLCLPPECHWGFKVLLELGRGVLSITFSYLLSRGKAENAIEGTVNEDVNARYTDYGLQSFLKMKEMKNSKCMKVNESSDGTVVGSAGGGDHDENGGVLQMCTGSVSEMIERLLQDLHDKASVYKYENGCYVIISDKKTIKIIECKSEAPSGTETQLTQCIFVIQNKENVSRTVH